MRKTGYYAYIAISCCFGIAVTSSSFHGGLLFLFCCYAYWIFIKSNSIPLSISVIFSAILFSIYMNVTDSFNFSKHSPSDQHFNTQLVEPINIDGNKVTFEVKTEKGERLPIEYYMDKQDELASFSGLQIGDLCQLTGVLQKPTSATNPHAFDYQKFLYYQQIHWTLTLTKPPVGCNAPTNKTFLQQIKQSRENGIQTIKGRFTQPVAGFMISLIFGDRSYIEQEVLDSYQLLGVIHILAISGLHVGVITSAIFLIGIRIGVTRQYMNGILITLLPFYIIIAGGAPSVMRAALMTGIVLLYMLVKRRFLSIDAIGIACILILLIDPYYLFHIGFQLSFLVSLALLLSVKRIRNITNKTLQVFYVSLIAQIASLPVILYNFYQLSIWSPLLNLLVVTFFSLFVLPYSFVLFLCMFLAPFLLPFLIPILSIPLGLLNDFVVWVSTFPFGTMMFGKPSIWIIASYAVAIVFLFYQIEVLVKRNLYTAIVCFFLCCIIHWNSGYFDSKGKVVVIDIGQGEAIFIKLPYKKATYLIDTGGLFIFPDEEWKKRKNEFDGGEKILLPFLKAEGVRKLDKLLLTHGDYDHIGNVPSVLRNIKVKEVYVPYGFGKGDFEQEIIMELENKKIPLTVVMDYKGWEIQNQRFHLLHPSFAYDAKNDGSIVLYAELGGLTWLFTGDIEERGEKDLINKYPHLKVDVLKVAHHGSRSSTIAPFLNQIHPEYAVISAGRENRFGHPHDEVIERLEEIGVKIYRTDQKGAILYTFTLRGGTFSTVLP
ncbi:DNA internalization-related competence protein ComEC/Rec2 [Sutcliffiella halmapala]|uniref:DNA internalization-related competence protein ComEC/Rec2 n=1 Tax=Sutcliffiella halmapala TaxID=79882 RepID=UPI000995D05B|nr:DNA internalization-related competence protein ComEC/Rec2 [Sutcliffiella halmapala]